MLSSTLSKSTSIGMFALYDIFIFVLFSLMPLSQIFPYVVNSCVSSTLVEICAYPINLFSNLWVIIVLTTTRICCFNLLSAFWYFLNRYVSLLCVTLMVLIWSCVTSAGITGIRVELMGGHKCDVC